MLTCGCNLVQSSGYCELGFPLLVEFDCQKVRWDMFLVFLLTGSPGIYLYCVGGPIPSTTFKWHSFSLEVRGEKKNHHFYYSKEEKVVTTAMHVHIHKPMAVKCKIGFVTGMNICRARDQFCMSCLPCDAYDHNHNQYILCTTSILDTAPLLVWMSIRWTTE